MVAVVIPFPGQHPVSSRAKFAAEVKAEVDRRVLPPGWLEPEWDSDDSNACQDRVEAGLESQYSDD